MKVKFFTGMFLVLGSFSWGQSKMGPYAIVDFIKVDPGKDYAYERVEKGIVETYPLCAKKSW